MAQAKKFDTDPKTHDDLQWRFTLYPYSVESNQVWTQLFVRHRNIITGKFPKRWEIVSRYDYYGEWIDPIQTRDNILLKVGGCNRYGMPVIHNNDLIDLVCFEDIHIISHALNLTREEAQKFCNNIRCKIPDMLRNYQMCTDVVERERLKGFTAYQMGGYGYKWLSDNKILDRCEENADAANREWKSIINLKH